MSNNVMTRGAGYLFGGDVVEKFNSTNNIELICRAHQLVMEGYKTMFDNALVTVWSAPNYCYRCANVAAILELDEHLVKRFKIVDAAPPQVRCVHIPACFQKNITRLFLFIASRCSCENTGA